MISIKNGGEFAAKGRFKKWYKQGFLGILVFVLVNGRVERNMSTEIDGIIRQNVNNANWRVYVEEEMLNWMDPLDEDVESEQKEEHDFGEPFPVTIDDNTPQSNCYVV